MDIFESHVKRFWNLEHTVNFGPVCSQSSSATSLSQLESAGGIWNSGGLQSTSGSPAVHPPLFGANHSPNPRINTVRKQSDGVEWRSDMAPERAPTRSDGIERTNGLVRSVALFGINVSTPEVCNGFQSHLYIQCRRVGRIRSYFHCNYSMAH